MRCDIVPAVQLDGVTVSSTLTRSLLTEGRVEEAARLLGRPFSLSGSICRGKGLGRRIGAPTLNLIPPAGQLIPAHGVYITRVTVDGESYGAVTNVGVRPTVDTDGGVTVESHLLAQDLQLYGRECRVEFLQMLRPERAFPDLAALQNQIALDTAAAKTYFEA